MKCLREYYSRHREEWLKAYAAWYGRLRGWFYAHPVCTVAFRYMYKILPLVMAGAYGMLLVYAFLIKFIGDGFLGVDGGLVGLVAVPLSVFVLLSVLRKMIDRTRPYAAGLGIDTLLVKKRRGESFPSRHSYAAGIIAAAFIDAGFVLDYMWNGAMCLMWCIICGIMVVLSVLVALTRIAAGVHYPTDAVGGLVLGYVCAGVLFLIIAL